MMFSATYTQSIMDTIMKHMRKPQFVLLSADEPSLLGVRQYYAILQGAPVDRLRSGLECSRRRFNPYELFKEKLKFLLELLSQVSFHQCVVFSNKKGQAAELVSTLNEHGWATVGTGGDLNQKVKACGHFLVNFLLCVLHFCDKRIFSRIAWKLCSIYAIFKLEYSYRR